MITYSWNCKTVDCYPQQDNENNVVYKVHWRVTAISSELNTEGQPYLADSIGTQTLDTGDITDFIPFEELTNDEVTAWTKSAMGDEQVEQIESGLEYEINSLITPKSITLTIE